MANEYTFTITCTYRYYGSPQAIRHYTITSPHLECKLTYYGNQGYDLPVVTNNHHMCNGYFWHMQTLVKKLFSGHILNNELLQTLASLGEGKSANITLQG